MWGQADEKHLPELIKKSYRRQEKIKKKNKNKQKKSFKVQGEAYLWGKKKKTQCNISEVVLHFQYDMAWTL